MKKRTVATKTLKPQQPEFPVDPIVEEFRKIPTVEEMVNQWSPFLHQQSYRTWMRLPVQMKVWLDPEDLYQEAYMEAYRAYYAWDRSRSGYSTVMFRFVKNRLSSLATHWMCQKRNCSGQVPLFTRNEENQEVCVLDREQFQPVDLLPIDPVLAFLGET